MVKRIQQVYITSGHSACPGCCDIYAAKFMLMGTGPDVIVVNPTGCLEVTTSPYPYSSWQVPWIHSFFKMPPQWNSVRCQHHYNSGRKILFRKPTP